MEVTVNERGASDQQPCAAPLVRLQAGQRWAGHAIDPTLSWPQVDCFDGSLHGARRIGLRISGEIEKNSPAGAHRKRRLSRSEDPLRWGKNKWVPSAAIGGRPKTLRGLPESQARPLMSCAQLFYFQKSLNRSGASSV